MARNHRLEMHGNDAMKCMDFVHETEHIFAQEKKALKRTIPSMYDIFTHTFTIFYHSKQPHVGKYTSPMDGMGEWARLYDICQTQS